jgi:hypothetical protein
MPASTGKARQIKPCHRDKNGGREQGAHRSEPENDGNQEKNPQQQIDQPVRPVSSEAGWFRRRHLMSLCCVGKAPLRRCQTGHIAPGIGAREGCLRFALFRASVSVIYALFFSPSKPYSDHVHIQIHEYSYTHDEQDY